MSRSGEPGTGEPVRVMLLTSSLEAGGAERQVIELAKALVSGRFDPLVCSLSPEVPLAASLPDRERRLVVVPKRWRFDVTTIPRVARVMKRERIRLVQSFLFDADMVARLAAPWGGKAAVIASERNADYERPRLQSIFLKLTRRYVDALVANSRAGQRFTMRTLGMPESDVYVIHNGVDVDRFHPRDRAEARTALGLPPQGRVVGMVASFKPQKNHLLFLEVARRVLDRVPDVLFVCAGEVLRGAGTSAFSLRAGTGAHRNVDDYHRRVGRALEEHRLGEKVRLLGAVGEVERVYNACDLTLLTSLHEGTPNVLLESMASGVPVVATAVSDNAEIVPEGRVGHVVPSGDAAAMADRAVALLTAEARREALGRAAREWAEREFSTSALARKTGAVYEEVLRRKAHVR